ncbi:MAG: aldehyde dehydrogenase family protein [Flavobacteriales bacterium AspAUS03]
MTQECGKTINESRSELQHAIENIELCYDMPIQIQSEFIENITPGIEEYIIQQPVGVYAAICPFNFRGMILLLVPNLCIIQW